MHLHILEVRNSAFADVGMIQCPHQPITAGSFVKFANKCLRSYYPRQASYSACLLAMNQICELAYSILYANKEIVITLQEA